MNQLIDKTYSFYCDNLNIGKYDILYNKALNIRDFKNHISDVVYNNPLYFINKSKFEWINYFRTKLDYCNNQDISHAISDVYVAYDNKRQQFQHKTSVKIQDKINKTYYKRKTKHHKKGDVKTFNVKLKSNEFTKVITYLTKYYHEGLINFLYNNKSDDNNHQQFRNNAIYYYEKFGGRLIDLVKAKQKRVINQTFKHKIEFSSLTFTSTTEQRINIINKNPRTTSKFNAYITLPAQGLNNNEKIHIPTKYAPNFHGSLQHFYKELNKNGKRQITYKIIFLEDKIKINLTRKKVNETITNKHNYYGVDVNVKHNLFADKHGNTIDYDRENLNEYVDLLKKLDNKQQRKGTTELSKKDQKVKDKYRIRFENDLKFNCNKLVKQAKAQGYDHLVIENLESFGKSYSKNDELNGFKYSRLTKILRLANIKHYIESIANKHGLQVTFVQSHYTSQTCKCGTIDKRNRPNQETFKCISCGLTANADAHSADMIEDRMTLDVLKSKLLKFDNGLYKPNKKGKSSIKSILEECYDSNRCKPEQLV